MSSKVGVAPAYPLGHKWIAGVQTAWMRAGNHPNHKRIVTSVYTGYRQSMPVWRLFEGHPFRWKSYVIRNYFL